MQITKRNAQAAGRTCGNTDRNVELLLGVLLLALSAWAQTVGSQRVVVTAPEGDSWLNHLHRSVPDGQYSVVSWHEGAKAETKRVALAGGAKADSSLSK
jgi:hypothetical protein